MFHQLACVFGILCCLAFSCYGQGDFTLNIGAAAVPPATLVKFDDIWRYHLGTNAPQTDWKTNLNDSAFDATVWGSGPGGFGYEDGDDNTLLLVMSNRCTTLYIRKTFEIPAGLDPSRNLRLTMDWDDGFIAWIDGVEVARSANAPAGEPPNTAISNPPNHEASRGPSGNPPTNYDLGSVGSRLTPGTHVLAIMGLNGALTSGDFSLIADLIVAGSLGGADADGYFALVRTNTITLSGSNTMANAARVTVNGFPATYDSIAGTWSRVQTLQPGMNRLFVASLDAQGNILGSIGKDIVSELNAINVGGTISANTTWSGTVRVTNDLVVNSSATLSVSPGTVVLMSPTASVRATNNSVVDVAGTLDQPVFFLPANGNTPWRDVAAMGANSHLQLRHTEVVAAQVRVFNGGSCLMEDSVLRDLPTTTLEVIEAVNGTQLTLRRSYFARFSELDSVDTPVLIEDCLLEHFLVDGIDMKTSTGSPLLVRRTTFRYADPNNSNADAIDFGPGAGTVERCLIHGFPDKGVSIGGAPSTQIRESLIYNCGIGVSAYSSTNLVVEQTTIVACTNGILFRNNPQPAVGSASNLIVWGNATNVAVLNTSTLNISSSDIEGGFPGSGNISADPLFASGYQIPGNSPAAGMGAKFPLGGIPSAPFSLAVLVNGTGPLNLSWHEDADNETGFRIDRSMDGMNWGFLTSLGSDQTAYTDSSADFGTLYFYRVRTENSSGISPWSNPASGIRQQAVLFVSGTLTQNTTWSPAMGRFIVDANLIVPTNITLTILPGTDVQVTNNASIRAGAGGTINITGTRAQPVIIDAANPAQTWGELSAQGPGASITIRFGEIGRGQVTVYSNAVGLFEDSYFHDYRITGGTIFTSPIMLTHFAAPTTVRGCHFFEYHEVLLRNSLMTVEDSLFEGVHGDALDFDGTLIGTVLRRCTFRNGPGGNIDAVDVGNDGSRFSFGTIIEDCLMYNFPNDKGVSIGDGSQGIIVRNCLVYGCDSGVAVKDSCTALVYQNTLANNGFGYKNFNKQNPAAATGGGHITNGWNNILWNNITNVSMQNGGTMTNDHSNLGTNWPGAGNINIDPLFVSTALHDYRLLPNSPSRGTGRDGGDMGAHFPVGAPMASSHPEFQSIEDIQNGVRLTFWADSERTYTIYYGPTVTGPWTELQRVFSPPRPRLMEVVDALEPRANTGNRFYRLVSP